VAGLDRANDRHLRPVVTMAAGLTRDLLVEHGGPIEVGAVVDLGAVRPTPARPEVEDVVVEPDRLQWVERLDEEEYLHAIDAACQESLEDAFGPDLQPHGWRRAVVIGKGERSLACIRLGRPPHLEIDTKYGERLQLQIPDGAGTAYVPVNDLRFYEADHETLRASVIEDFQRRLRRGVRTWAMFGLTRPFPSQGDEVKRHWLQVNGLCLADSPLE
jgi:hypothetical protein